MREPLTGRSCAPSWVGGLALLLIGLLILAAPRARAQAIAGVDIPPYPGAELIPMGGASASNGRPLAMYGFSTSDPPEKVLEHYRTMWEQDGQYVSIFRGQDGNLSVGYVNLADGGTRTVSLVQQGGTTMGFPAVLRGVPMLYSPSHGVAGDIPVHPRAEGLSVYESFEKGGAFRTINYSVLSPMSVVESFYLREFGERGFALGGRHSLKEDPDTVMLEFDKGTRRVSLTLAWVSRFQACSVFVVTNATASGPREDKP